MEDIHSTYQQALDYLYSFVDYSLTKSFTFSAEKFDLDRMRRFLEFFGNPQTKFPCIHVAGTKGKGSTSAMIASIYQAAGYKTGLYTSPHLQDFNERIQINGVQITDEELVELVEFIKPHVAKVAQLTTFELTTALGFLFFARHKVDVAVIEVGLGGRLDATNVITPVLSVITKISLDHMNVLGNSIELIAGEKAGIIKPGVPVVISPQKEEALNVFKKVSEEKKARLLQVGVDFTYQPMEHSLSGQTLKLQKIDHNEQEKIITIPLLGKHQVENAATAYAAVKTAQIPGVSVNDEAIATGFSSVYWPGRFELLRISPPVIVDSAHNRDSAMRLRETLDEYFPGEPVIMVFGASEDKDVFGMFDELDPRISRVFATKSTHPRAMPLKRILEAACSHKKPVKQFETVEEALSAALEAAGGFAIVLVTGSLFVAAAARDTWCKMGFSLQNSQS